MMPYDGPIDPVSAPVTLTVTGSMASPAPTPPAGSGFTGTSPLPRATTGFAARPHARTGSRHPHDVVRVTSVVYCGFDSGFYLVGTF